MTDCLLLSRQTGTQRKPALSARTQRHRPMTSLEVHPQATQATIHAARKLVRYHSKERYRCLHPPRGKSKDYSKANWHATAIDAIKRNLKLNRPLYNGYIPITTFRNKVKIEAIFGADATGEILGRPYRCFACLIIFGSLKSMDGPGGWCSPELDRLNSHETYIAGNVRWACRCCNGERQKNPVTDDWLHDRLHLWRHPCADGCICPNSYVR